MNWSKLSFLQRIWTCRYKERNLFQDGPLSTITGVLQRREHSTCGLMLSSFQTSLTKLSFRAFSSWKCGQDGPHLKIENRAQNEWAWCTPVTWSRHRVERGICPFLGQSLDEDQSLGQDRTIPLKKRWLGKDRQGMARGRQRLRHFLIIFLSSPSLLGSLDVQVKVWNLTLSWRSLARRSRSSFNPEKGRRGKEGTIIATGEVLSFRALPFSLMITKLRDERKDTVGSWIVPFCQQLFSFIIFVLVMAAVWTLIAATWQQRSLVPPVCTFPLFSLPGGNSVLCCEENPVLFSSWKNRSFIKWTVRPRLSRTILSQAVHLLSVWSERRTLQRKKKETLGRSSSRAARTSSKTSVVCCLRSKQKEA